MPSRQSTGLRGGPGRRGQVPNSRKFLGVGALGEPLGSTLHGGVSGKWNGFQKSLNPFRSLAAFRSNVKVAEHPHQVPSAPIKASSNVPEPFLSANRA